MMTFVLWMGAAAAVVAATAWVNNLRFSRRVSREVRKMWRDTAEPRRLDPGQIEALPGPVRQYLARAIGGRLSAIERARLRHGGTFRPKLDGAWLPIRGQQYFAADPPSFVWWGRVRVAPGVWIDARDRCVGGTGNMFVSAESTFTLADNSGPELDQGALLRLLAEMVWFPTAFLDGRYLTWGAVDERRAQVTLRVNGREATGTFEFGDVGLPVAFFGDRYRDLGGGRSVLTPFTGEVGDYRGVAGVLVPHQVTACWVVDGQRIPYARFLVERLEYDVDEPVRRRPPRRLPEGP